MATVYWTGNALARKQVQTITVASTWLDTETATLTMNGKDLVLTLVGDESTANVATALKEMWMATKALDGTSTTDATTNAGGYMFGEFAEVTATVSGSVVTLTANKAGVPFTVTVAETSASGTLTLGTVQTATGPNHWDNDDNWSGGAYPSYGDIMIVRDTDVSVKYGMSNLAFEGTLIIHSSFTGQIGLPVINRDNPAKPYKEYRQTFLGFGESGFSGTTYTHRFGVGDGPGSSFINFRHHALTNTRVNAVVYNTGRPTLPGTKALTITIDNTTFTGGVTILRGSVQLGEPGVDHAITSLVVQEPNCDVTVIEQAGTLTYRQAGGRVLFHDSVPQLTAVRTFYIDGGTCTMQDMNISGAFSTEIGNGRLIFNSQATIASAIIQDQGILDLEQDRRAVTITTCDLFSGASLFDRYTRTIYTAGIDLNRCSNADVRIRFGNHRRVTLGAVA